MCRARAEWAVDIAADWPIKMTQVASPANGAATRSRKTRVWQIVRVMVVSFEARGRQFAVAALEFRCLIL
jgi:hypothetical protein